MLPTIQNSIKYIHNDDYFNLIERILKLAIPTVYAWIIMFYAFFHSWLNLLAELTQYGDRTFYKDWWNSLYLDEYWRTWNLVRYFFMNFSQLIFGLWDTSITHLEEEKSEKLRVVELCSLFRPCFMSMSFPELWAMLITGRFLRCLLTSLFL